MDLLVDLVTSPYIQFFILALVAGLFRSDLEIPDQFTKVMAMLLMLTIGLKGGLSLRDSTTPFSEIALVLGAGIAIGFLIPFIGYALLKKTTQLSQLDAAALAAHYGSISVVTFSYAITYLESHGYDYPGYIITLMAFMEGPAIFSGLLLAKRGQKGKQKNIFTPHLLKDALMNSSIVLLLGGMVMGYSADAAKMDAVSVYFIKPFPAILCLFLLELGLLTARQLRDSRDLKAPIILFSLYMPIIAATIGFSVAYLLRLEIGAAILFATLCGSASYIAVPAAMRLALPKANIPLCVTCSLALTFPFNLFVGVPLYGYIATQLFN